MQEQKQEQLVAGISPQSIAPKTGLLDSLAPDPPPISDGSMSQEELIAQVQLYLNRMFSVGELLPWKGCIFELVGIRGGLLGLRLQRTTRKTPKPQSGKGHSKAGLYLKRKRAKKKAAKLKK